VGYGPSAFLPTNGGIQNAGGQRGQFPTTSHNRRLTARRTRPVTIYVQTFPKQSTVAAPSCSSFGGLFTRRSSSNQATSCCGSTSQLGRGAVFKFRTRHQTSSSRQKYLCSLTTQTQKSATTTPTGGNDLPHDRVAMREICQSLRTQSAQVSALQRQQDAGRSSFRGFLAEAESSAQHSLSLKLSEADQQYYQNYELKKQTM
jgi:hypothetical protein